MSDNLKAFLAAWLEWAEAGAPDSERHTALNPCRFDAECGLCSNTHNFEETALDVMPSGTGRLEEELHEALEEDGLSIGYPFGGHDLYEGEAQRATHHKNERRLAWVRETLEAWTCAT